MNNICKRNLLNIFFKNIFLKMFFFYRRAFELLRTGGLLSYSSCSMNPVENEAVLGRLLKEADGAIQILDVKVNI